MKFCPACGVNLRDGVFFASSVVRNQDGTIQIDEETETAIRVYNIPFKADVYKARVCQYAKVMGCINTTTEFDSTQTFENRTKKDLGVDASIDRWLEVAEDLLKHD